MGQLLGRFGQGVLLAAEPGDEPAAAHQTPILEPAERPLQVPPRQAQRVVDGQVAEQDPPPAEQLLGDGLGQLFAVADLAGGGDERPPPGRRRRRLGSRPRRDRRGRPAGGPGVAGGRRRAGPGWRRTRRT